MAFQKVLQENTGFPVGVKSLKVFMEVRVGVGWGHMKTIKTEHAISHPAKAPRVASCPYDSLRLTLPTPLRRAAIEASEP